MGKIYDYVLIMQSNPTKTELVIDDKIIVTNLIVAEKMLTRMVGLLKYGSLPAGSAMLIKPCGSIHTVGMRFDLDVIFVDREMRVVRTVCGVKPNRFVLGGRGASVTVEMQSGWFDMSQVKIGHKLIFREEKASQG